MKITVKQLRELVKEALKVSPLQSAIFKYYAADAEEQKVMLEDFVNLSKSKNFDDEYNELGAAQKYPGMKQQDFRDAAKAIDPSGAKWSDLNRRKARGAGSP